MLSENIVTALYIAASVLFILSLGDCLARKVAGCLVWNCWYGTGCIGHYLWSIGFGHHQLVASVVVGAVIGGVVAMRVEMTGMPQLVAALHSFAGLGVFIGINRFCAATRINGRRKNYP